MDYTGPVVADDWEKIALNKLKAAIHLKQIRSLAEDYEQAGCAIECALKARIMRHERLNQWPSRDRRRELYTHDLAFLMKSAGLEPQMLIEVVSATNIGVAWSIAKEWSVDARYARDMRPKLVRDMGCGAIRRGVGAMDYRDVEPGVERWSAGLEILGLTDRLGFAAQAAGWIYAPEHDLWRYYLITPMVDEQGPRWIYERLLKVFGKVTLPPGITPLDIYIGSPRDALYRTLEAAGMNQRFAETGGNYPKTPPMRLDIDGLEIAPGVVVARALLYRLEAKPEKPHPKLFDRRVRQLLAA